jgi:hypothetical protein
MPAIGKMSHGWRIGLVHQYLGSRHTQVGGCIPCPNRDQACYGSTSDGPDPGHRSCFFINRSRR